MPSLHGDDQLKMLEVPRVTKHVEFAVMDDGTFTLPGCHDAGEVIKMYRCLLGEIKKDLKEYDVCPACERKFNKKAQKYQPTRQMVEIMFEMARIMNADIKQRKFVYMIETPESKKGDERLIATSKGIKQNHKMRMMDLISCVDHEGKACPKTAKRKLGAYTITQRGWDLLNGLKISPWQIHIQKAKAVLLDEDKQTSGSITDVQDLTYEEWVEMAGAANIPLKLP